MCQLLLKNNTDEKMCVCVCVCVCMSTVVEGFYCEAAAGSVKPASVPPAACVLLQVFFGFFTHCYDSMGPL